ncbi:DUF4298 domain-containing protein [Aerococcaceae bacterium NML190938]|nr:DUF4298 domain-containing protein [Aerococcaceae bacterium NML190938]
MEQIKRIEQMEAYLDKGEAQVEQLLQLVENFATTQEELTQLFDYYGSEQWFEDKEASDNYQLPSELKCGILSEDAIYNLMTEHRVLAIRLLELATQMLR